LETETYNHDAKIKLQPDFNCRKKTNIYNGEWSFDASS
jgi:hypothetical protein